MRMALLLLVLTAHAAGQVDRDLWLGVGGQLFRVSTSGVVLQQFPLSCTSIVLPCQTKVARDRAGNVYAGTLEFFAPGVGGNIRVFRAGQGQVSLLSDRPAAMVVDATDGLWSVSLSYSSSQMTTSASLRRYGAGLTNVASLPLAYGFGLLAPHPVSGVWLAHGNGVVSRVVSSGPTTLALTGSLTLPGGVVEMAADARGRLWIADGGQTLRRIREDVGGTLVEEWSLPMAGGAIRIGGCGTVYLHNRTPTASVLTILDPEGQLISTTTYPPVNMIHVGTDGSLWAQHGAPLTGASLIHLDGAASTITPLGMPPGPFFNFGASDGDIVGTIYAHVLAATEDSDGDGSSNGREFQLGADPFDSAVRPPILTPTPLFPPSAGWAITYQDGNAGHGGLSCQLACAFTAISGVGIGPLGTCPTMPLDADPLFFASLALGPPLFQGFGSTLDPSGSTTATLTLPPGMPPNIAIHLSGVTYTASPIAIVAIADVAVVVTP